MHSTSGFSLPEHHGGGHLGQQGMMELVSLHLIDSACGTCAGEWSLVMEPVGGDGGGGWQEDTQVAGSDASQGIGFLVSSRFTRP